MLIFFLCFPSVFQAMQPSSQASAPLVRKEVGLPAVGPDRVGAIMRSGFWIGWDGDLFDAGPHLQLLQSAARATGPSLAASDGLRPWGATNASGEGVPRLIHQTFKTRLTTNGSGTFPNPVWQMSEESWRKFFPAQGGSDGAEISSGPAYQYRMWSDDDIVAFFAEHCEPQVGQLPQYDNKISLSDIGRYCILWKLGGIYSDLDYEPRAHFYDHFAKDRVSLVQSPYRSETFQNSLMASPPGMSYWLDALRQALRRQHSEGDANDRTGPRLLESLAASHDPSVVHMLPCKDFQRATHNWNVDAKKACGMLDSSNVKTVLGIHWGTWSWIDQSKVGLGKDASGETDSLFKSCFGQLHPDREFNGDTVLPAR